MKYFLSKRFFNLFCKEITNEKIIKQIERHENLKVFDVITIIDEGIDYKLTLKNIISDEMYFEY